MRTMQDAMDLIARAACACTEADVPEEVNREFNRQFNRIGQALSEDYEIPLNEVISTSWRRPLGPRATKEFEGLETMYAIRFFRQ